MASFFRKKLPDCNELFEKFFSLWYDEENRPKIARPDMYQIAVYEGEPLDLDKIQYLPNDLIANVKQHINVDMVEAALEDFQHIFKSNKLDMNVLDAVDKYYDRKKISELIKESDPKDFSNSYLVTVCEFGAMLGYLFKQIEGFDWLYSHPYFHSMIVHKETGFGITVFDWAIKKFSEYGVDDGYVAKFNAAIAGINGEWEDDEDN